MSDFFYVIINGIPIKSECNSYLQIIDTTYKKFWEVDLVKKEIWEVIGNWVVERSDEFCKYEK